jgi:8-oxo-dGTP pyrophosphatase MutT (NUDIX family)
VIKTGPRHPIQLSIIEVLRVAPEGLRYARMRPEGIENDLYNYHLQYLLKQKLVEKHADKYTLSDGGKRYLMELNPLNEHGESNRFKMASLCLVTRKTTKGTEVLYQQRVRQPFAGEWGLIGGGIHRGEPAIQAASRRLREEAGLFAEFRLAGLMRKIKFDKEGELYGDILFHVCVADKYTGELVAENNYGKQRWIPHEEAIKYELTSTIGSKRFAGMIPELISDKSKDLSLFYLEEFYSIDIF